LVNPLPLIQWNLHKAYLEELRLQGIPVVPTQWVPKGAEAPFEQVLRDRGWRKAVVKPAISAGSFSTRSFSADDSHRAQRFLDTRTRRMDMMIQEHIASVDAEGERAIVWIAGEVTHVVRKAPRFSKDDERVSRGMAPTAEERAFAEAAMAKWRDEALYARVDVMSGTDGQLLLSELELIEPSLFFLQCPRALDRFVDAVAKLR
jgi:hypothetical protein